ncbi:MAG: TetR/AcrR family transcriptional regulator [Burkholderiaceae bacterium]|jgi:AcrR family transcriptional regulator|nr:TetR/AcrR family transcriptional regulator [Burkholderiaceae bacterium]
MPSTIPSPPAKVRRTQEERRASSESALISAALKVLAVKGAAGMTLAEVAETAGVSKGLVVHLYGNKKGLQLAVLNHLRGEFSRRLSRGNAQGARGLEFLRTFIRMFVGSLGSAESNIKIYSALLSEAIFQDKSFASAVAAMNSATIKLVRKCLEAEQLRGAQFIEPDLTSLATFIVATLSGIAQIFSINESAQTRKLATAKLQTLCQAMLDGMVIKK